MTDLRSVRPRWISYDLIFYPFTFLIQKPDKYYPEEKVKDRKHDNGHDDPNDDGMNS